MKYVQIVKCVRIVDLCVFFLSNLYRTKFRFSKLKTLKSFMDLNFTLSYLSLNNFSQLI
jgi:hypothetical protein